MELSIKETDPRFINLERKVGLFVLFAFLFFISIGFFIAFEKGVFTPTYSIWFITDDASGISEGMPVKLCGFKIGRVKSISLNQRANVEVVLLIGKKYKRWIRRDSVAKLVKEGIVGGEFIEINVGSNNLPEIEDKGFIAFKKETGPEEILEETRKVLGEVDKLLVYLNNPKGDLKKSIENITTTTSNLITFSRELNKAVIELKKAISESKNAVVQTKKLLSETEKIANSLNSIVREVDKKSPTFVKRMDTVLKNLESISKSVDSDLKFFSPKLPVIINQTEEALKSSNEIMDAVKDIWPIRSHVKREKENIAFDESY